MRHDDVFGGITMPDIVSRIKVEAQGADAAAREIRKLKKAYDEVAAAAKGIGGGTDPFSAATESGGGASSAEVRDRQKSNDDQKQVADSRLNNNKQYPNQNGNYPAAYGGSNLQQQGGNKFINMANTAFSGAQQANAGQMAGGIGTVLSGIAAFMTSPAGIALIAAGTLAKGVQTLATPAVERRTRIWGSGATQRMGGNYTDTANWEALMGAEGIPLDQVRAFTSAASNTGFSWDNPGASYAAGIAMQAQASTGLSVNTSAGMIGALSKAGMHQANFNKSTIGAGVGAFGVENLGTYISGLTNVINTRESQGIQMTSESLKGMQSLITGLGVTGGLSIDASVAAGNRISARGISAAKLGSPDDILSMFAMGGVGKSLTDTQIMMEQEPEKVATAVYDILKTRYSGDEDSLNQAFMQYTKGTMSETVALRKVLDEGGSYKDYRTAWDTKTADQKLQGTLQLQPLFQMQEAALEKIVGAFAKSASDFLGRGQTMDAEGVSYGARFGGSFNMGLADIDADVVLLDADNVVQDNSGLFKRSSALGSNLGFDLSDTATAFKQGNIGSQLFGGAGQVGSGKAAVYGGWGEYTYEMVQGILQDARKEQRSMPQGRSKTKAGSLISGLTMEYADTDAQSDYYRFTSEKEAMDVFYAILAELTRVLPVNTDGDD